MRPLLRALACAALLLLVACSAGKPKRIYPPTASVQQLLVQPDGRWALKLRLQNFSNVGMRIERVDARLELGEVHAADLVAQPGFVVPASSVEVLELVVTPTEAAREPVAAVLRGGSGLRYRLSGTLVSSEPRQREDEFEHASALAPVPGLQDTLR